MKKTITTFTLFFIISTILLSQNWQFLGGAPVIPNSIYQEQDKIYIGTGNDLLESVDDGANWKSFYQEHPPQDTQLVGYTNHPRFNSLNSKYYEHSTLLFEELYYNFPNIETKIYFSGDRGQTKGTHITSTGTGSRSSGDFFKYLEKDENTFLLTTQILSRGIFRFSKFTTDGGATWDDYKHKSKEIPLGWVGDLFVGIVDTQLVFRNFPDTSTHSKMNIQGGNLFIQDDKIFSSWISDFGKLNICSTTVGNSTWNCSEFSFNQFDEESRFILFTRENKLWILEVPMSGNNSNCRIFIKSDLESTDDLVEVPIQISSKANTFTFQESNGNLFLLTGTHQVLKSTDDGLTWDEMEPMGEGKGRSTNNVLSVFDEDELWVTSNFQALYKYEGENLWTACEPDLTEFGSILQIRGFQKFEGKYFLTMRNGGVYEWSGQCGDALQEVIAPIMVNSLTSVELSQSDGRLFYGGYVYDQNIRGFVRSYFYTDNGIDWIPFNSSQNADNGFYKSGNRILACSTSYLLTSEDDGQTFTILMPARLASPIRRSVVDDELYFTGSKSLLFTSSDDGLTFSEKQVYYPYRHNSHNLVKTLRQEDTYLDITENMFYKGQIGDTVRTRIFDIPFLRATNFTSQDDQLYFTSLAEGIWAINPAELTNFSDLELSMDTDDIRPDQWSNFTVNLTIRNTGSIANDNIVVEIPMPDGVLFQGGNEYQSSQGNFDFWRTFQWEVGSLEPSEEAVISLNLFRLNKDFFCHYAQVIAADVSDLDSTPANGDDTSCFSREDDEAVIGIREPLAGITNRNSTIETIENLSFAIVNAMPNPFADQFKLQVFSNENQESELSIMNAMGQSIFQKEVNLTEGMNTISVDLNDEASGILMVKMTPFHPYLRQIRVMRVRD